MSYTMPFLPFQNYSQPSYTYVQPAKTKSKKEMQSIQKFHQTFQGDSTKGKELLNSSEFFVNKIISCSLWGHICKVLGKQNQLLPSIGRNHRYADCVYKYVDSLHDQMVAILQTLKVYNYSMSEQNQGIESPIIKKILQQANDNPSDPKKLCHSVVYLSVNHQEFFFAIPLDKKTVFPFDSFGEPINSNQVQKQECGNFFNQDGDKTDIFKQFVNPLSSEDDDFLYL